MMLSINNLKFLQKMLFSAERHYIACKTLQLKHDRFIGKYYHKMHQVKNTLFQLIFKEMRKVLLGQ